MTSHVWGTINNVVALVWNEEKNYDVYMRAYEVYSRDDTTDNLYFDDDR